MNSFSGNKFLLYAICVLGFVLYKTIRIEPKKNFICKIQVNKKNIKTINDLRISKHTKTEYIDTVNFPSSKHLSHSKHGPIGYNHNFFMDITGKFHVLESGEYEFRIKTDDGYMFFINDKKVSEFIKDRPADNFDSITLRLNKGIQEFFITYFQGRGNAALEVMYKSKDEKRFTHLGKDSNLIKFTPITD